MRKLFGAAAVCALTVGLVAAPGAGAVKSPKQVSGTVSVNVAPNPLPNAFATVTASGNVWASSGCRKDRKVHFAWFNPTTQVTTPVAVGGVLVIVTTGSNGNYTATVPRPAETAPTTTSMVLQAIVDPATRKVGSKKKGKKDKKGRQFHCLVIPTPPAPAGGAAVTLVP
ncbi:MAG: hypothetical protein ACRDK5_03315 [Solirubrobacterales bacterium]